jgi:hypothetical protein
MISSQVLNEATNEQRERGEGRQKKFGMDNDCRYGQEEQQHLALLV